MTHSQKRRAAPNAIRLSLEPKREASTFDPSRFGEIEISPELFAKFLRAKQHIRQEQLTGPSRSEQSTPGLPNTRMGAAARIRLAVALGTLIIVLLFGVLAVTLGHQ